MSFELRAPNPTYVIVEHVVRFRAVGGKIARASSMGQRETDGTQCARGSFMSGSVDLDQPPLDTTHSERSVFGVDVYTEYGLGILEELHPRREMN